MMGDTMNEGNEGDYKEWLEGYTFFQPYYNQNWT
jgi:hypothetical protein